MPDAAHSGARPAGGALVLPDDDANRELVANVRPPGWVNPTPSGRYNLVVVGGGTAGLVSAAAVAGLGGKVALIERGFLGGDCLNTGCVPSKALLRAARAVHDARAIGELGSRVDGRVIPDFAGAMARMRGLRAAISRHDSARRFTELGVDVFLGSARFLARDAVEIDGCRLLFSRAIIAAGSRAMVPAIPGLSEAGFLTNETVFSLTTLPRRLIVVGGGPIGCELAQAFRRFGSDVAIVCKDEHLLPREDPVVSDLLERQLTREGVSLSLGAHIHSVERRGNGRAEKVVHVGRAGTSEAHAIPADQILVAAGRTPNVEGLALEAAGIAFDDHGVTVDDRLRTSNGRVYAAGDICSRFKFTHAADAMARIAIQNALFFGRKKASALVMPWCTYTDPEVAHIGMSAAEAAERADEVVTLTLPMEEVDRAVLDGEADGFARVHADRKGRILGATIVARHAGEMVGEISLAMTAGVGLATLSRTVHPYPTQAEALKRLGDEFVRRRLTPRVHRILSRYLRWRR